uniref:BTB/POZ domain and ankyrin repeat-containing protein NPR1 n=1 Tax=Siraitia grosvenorii TaxID=190515 RepID=A0A7T0M7Z3_SIRGR|nr:BTB/POZ domain and ankyrin repeat-containing protein NPR1 [Siraitia grosvenorii]
MADSYEPSSSLSFTSSSYTNGSQSCNMSTSSASEALPSLEVISLNKLSSNLAQLLVDDGCDYTDAEIIVEGVSVGIHRCILSARSRFFHDLFQKDEKPLIEDSKPKYHMDELLPYGKVGYEAFLILLSYLYTGKLKSSPADVSTCVDNSCAHDACGPAIDFAVQLTYASYIFQIPELVSLFQRHLLNYAAKILAENVIQILVVAFHCQLGPLVTQCIDRIARSDLDSVSLEKELPYEVAESIKLVRLKSQSGDEQNLVPDISPCDKRIKRIRQALDSDDVELMKLLLSESDVTLDEANALHYAAAYCDPKTVSEVLNLSLADINLRNSCGYTVLHVAAMRKDPSVIISLLDKGAWPFDLTLDGRTAANICRRSTRPKDYHAKTEPGQEANKDRLCIDMLEREMWRNPPTTDSSILSLAMADDLHMKLLYLENRVAIARIIFPTEARLAMDIANADTTSEFSGLSIPKVSNKNLREVDLNETPSMQNKRFISRMQALMKTGYSCLTFSFFVS